MLLLDHIYLCVSVERKVVEALRELGLHSAFSRSHEGQGTANDLILFAGSYFELLYCTSRAEAEANQLALHRRFDHLSSGASPFGIALRGARADLDVEGWVPYQLPGMTSPLHIASQTLTDDRLPMVFCFEDPDPERGGPRKWGLEGSHFEHRCGAEGLTCARLAGPGYLAMSSWGLPELLDFADADAPSLKLGLAGASFGDLRVNELLTLR
jgi:hypothetical protein